MAMAASCIAARERKTEKYYAQHEAEILSLLQAYRTLNRQLPFSLAFTDKHYRHMGMTIQTDTMRYALNNEFGSNRYLQAIAGFGYDTIAIKSLQQQMGAIRCVRIGATDIFYRGRGDDAVILSFRSLLFSNPFMDQKYYNLVAFEPGFINPETDSLVRSQGYTHVRDEIYFKIMGTFR